MCKVLPEFAREAGIAVGANCDWEPELQENVSSQQLGCQLAGDGGSARQQPNPLAEVAYDYKDCIAASGLASRERHDPVNRYVLKGAAGHGQRIHESTWGSATGLGSSAFTTG